MADVHMKRGMRMLERKRKPSMTVPIIYRRGVAGLSIDATPNRGDSEQITETGAAIRLEDWSWIIRKSDLAGLTPSPPEPIPGDAIIMVDAFGTHEYTVIPANGQPCWRLCDEFDRNAIRVSTKFLKTV